jgi:hypothetical protein
VLVVRMQASRTNERASGCSSGARPAGLRLAPPTDCCRAPGSSSSPAYNEAENVGAVIEAMPKEIDGYHVIPVVIDDCSDDGTADAARAAGAFAASLPIRRGGGLALRTGYEIALKLGADIVVTIDADGQHQPEEMPSLVLPIVEGRPTT